MIINRLKQIFAHRDTTTITRYAVALSLFTLVAYHLPLARYVVGHVEAGFNGWVITISFAVLMLTVNFMIYTLLLRLLGIVGRVLLALLFLGNAIALYFINTYEVLITDMMMGNVFNTRFSEASGFFSASLILYLLFTGIPPILYIFMRRYKRGTWRRFGLSIASSLGVILLLATANYKNVLWIDRNATQIGSLIMPWSYVVNSFRYYGQQQRLNREAEPLPDAHIITDSRDVCVLVIGESARSMNFSLYGYKRNTCPLLSTNPITVYQSKSSATYTTAGVKAILDHKPTNELYEILPNYLSRSGVEVIWRTANWGEPPLKVDTYLDRKALAELYPEADERYDGLLFEGLREQIETSSADKLFVVLHLSTSHGPTYSEKYPAEFEQFTPVCTTVEMSEADHSELINAYDNTILYTDYLLHTLIGELSTIENRRSAMLFISDHGESLGEGGLYMHGMPMAVAPAEQTAIPFIVWENTSDMTTADLEEAGHYHIFHSVLNFLGLESEIYDAEMSVFRTTNNN
ncbi:MAG: phosphoethanolamine--lipid A transferase EptA [Alistipes sp.]|nr:phosphoethanolamine--lipid A transferase EptA [Alistipes sp.]